MTNNFLNQKDRTTDRCEWKDVESSLQGIIDSPIADDDDDDKDDNSPTQSAAPAPPPRPAYTKTASTRVYNKLYLLYS